MAGDKSNKHPPSDRFYVCPSGSAYQTKTQLAKEKENSNAPKDKQKELESANSDQLKEGKF